MQRLSVFLLLLASLLFVACSSDDAASPTAVSSGGAATATLGASSEAAIEGSITVDFAGAPDEKEGIEVSFEVGPGSTAWEAIQAALGDDRLTYNDFGGDLGIFIGGFDGVEAEGNHFWEFRLNGESSEVGVSKYQVQQGDVIEFVYSSF